MKNILRFVNFKILLKNTSDKKFNTIFFNNNSNFKKVGLFAKLKCYTFKYDY